AFDGGKTYRLSVPANAPVKQYWSTTVYDRATHALARDMSRASRASNSTEVQKNADGSVDIYFGPAAPAGKEANWVPTDPARKFDTNGPLLRTEEGVFREEVGAAGRGKDRCHSRNWSSEVTRRVHATATSMASAPTELREKPM